MKKSISAILVCVLLVCSLLSLTSCSKMLMGKYVAEMDVPIFGKSSVTYEFTPLGDVTMTTDPIVGDTTVKEGKYKIYQVGENEFTIAFTWEGEEAESEPVSFVTGNEGGVDYIKIGGFQLNKTE